MMIKKEGSSPDGSDGSIHVFTHKLGAADAARFDIGAPRLALDATVGTSVTAIANSTTGGVADFNGTDASATSTSVKFGEPNNTGSERFVKGLRK